MPMFPIRSRLLALLILAGCAGGRDLEPEAVHDSLGPQSGGSSSDEEPFETTGLTTDPGSGDGSTSGADEGQTSGSTGAMPDDPDSTRGSTSGAGDQTGSTGVATTGPGTTDAGTTGAGSDTSAGEMVDVSGWIIRQTDSDRTFTLPEGTLVPVGGVIVISRDSYLSAFESFWDVTLDDDVVFLDADDSFPAINGDETYAVQTPEQVMFDGPTMPLTVDGNAQRADPGTQGDDLWEVATADVANASPGGGPTWGALPHGVYLSEISDAPGPGNYPSEFVELRVY